MHAAPPRTARFALAALLLAAGLGWSLLWSHAPGFFAPRVVAAQSGSGGASEFEETLFLENPHLKNAQGVEVPGALTVISIPEPIQKYCMGKPAQQCSAIDFCIRTTTKSVAMCQNLPPRLRSLPTYPARMQPNRLYSITFFQQAPGIAGFAALRQYFDTAPNGSLDVLSTGASFRAQVRFTKTATDGNFDLLAVLSVPSA